MAEVTGSLPILVDADAGNIHFPQMSSLFCGASHVILSVTFIKSSLSKNAFTHWKTGEAPVVIGPSINQSTNQSINR